MASSRAYTLSQVPEATGATKVGYTPSGSGTGPTVQAALDALAVGINSTPTAFHAHRSSAQTSGTTVIFDTVDSQTGGTNYSNSTGVFTAPVTGVYLFTTAVTFLNNTGGNFTIVADITGPGGSAADGRIILANVTAGYISLTTVLALSATNTVSVTCSALAANLSVNSGTGTSFSAALLVRTS